MQSYRGSPGDRGVDIDQNALTRHLAKIAGIALTEEDLEQCQRLLDLEGRGFSALEDAVRGATITPAAAAVTAISLWPNKLDRISVDYQLWANMFRDAGFTADGHSAAPRTKPALLFRGATAENARGLSWTTDLEQARYFASSARQEGSGHAHVWMAWVPQHLMLAHYGQRGSAAGRGESEVIVDAAKLHRIVKLEAARVDQLMALHGGPFSGQRRKHLRWALKARRLRQECVAAIPPAPAR